MEKTLDQFLYNLKDSLVQALRGGHKTTYVLMVKDANHIQNIIDGITDFVTIKSEKYTEIDRNYKIDRQKYLFDDETPHYSVVTQNCGLFNGNLYRTSNPIATMENEVHEYHFIQKKEEELTIFYNFKDASLDQLRDISCLLASNCILIITQEDFMAYNFRSSGICTKFDQYMCFEITI